MIRIQNRSEDGLDPGNCLGREREREREREKEIWKERERERVRKEEGGQAEVMLVCKLKKIQSTFYS